MAAVTAVRSQAARVNLDFDGDYTVCGQNKSASSKVATWGARTAVELARAGTVDVRASAGCPSRNAPAVWQPAPPSDVTDYTHCRKKVNDFL